MSIILHDFTKEPWETIRPFYSLGPHIGGSEAPCVDGTNSFTSGYTLMMRKRGVEEFPDISGQLNVQRGHSLEPVALNEVAGIYDTNIFKPNCMLLSEDYPWAIADLDGVTDDGWMVEVKTTSSYPKIEQAKSGEVPPDYMSQGDHYLAFTQFEGCPNPGEPFKGVIYAIFHHVHQPLILIQVTREERLDNTRELMLKEEAFIKLFKSDQMPEPDGHPSTSKSLRAQYDTGRKTATASNDDLEDRNIYTEASKEIKRLEAIKLKAGNSLRSRMGSEIQSIKGVCSLDKRNILRVK
jgi:putative phage-type endonuclease